MTLEYSVNWHPKTEDDLAILPLNLARGIVKNTEHRLSLAPTTIGEPLKGTTSLLWKVGYSQYRVIYTIKDATKQVWVLSVQKRSKVYRTQHLESLIRLAASLQQ